MNFPQNPLCNLCVLAQGGCKSVNLPTRLLMAGTGGDKKTAILVVGEAPKYEEDLRGMNFVGKAGIYLQTVYLKGFGLQEFADIYGTDAVRCRVVSGDTPPPKSINACKVYLEKDLQLLAERYENVVVLGIGAVAARQIARLSLRDAMSRQGQRFTIGGLNLPCFFTFHPAALLQSSKQEKGKYQRDPTKINYVKNHLSMFRRYLENPAIFGQIVDCPEMEVSPEVPVDFPAEVSLDIETYGILEGSPQHYFHPKKCKRWDNPKQLIVSVALCWRDGNKFRTGFFRWGDSRLEKWLERIGEEGSTVVGSNLAFDLKMLREESEIVRGWRNVRLVDTVILNSLHQEDKPERSLKNLAPMYDLGRYAEVGPFPDTEEGWESLAKYNCRDAWVSLRLRDMLEELIGKKYGEDTWKLQESSRDWFSRVIWEQVRMGETGLEMDREGVEKELRGLQEKKKLVEEELEKVGVKVVGKGSQKSLSELFELAEVESGLEGSELLERTEKTHRLSTGEANLGLLVKILGGGRTRETLLNVLKWKKMSKLVSSFFGPMVEGRSYGKRKDMTPSLIGNLVYPDWYVSPSSVKDEDGEQGGTNQVRWTCKGPGVQTWPPEVQRFMAIDWSADYSQLELRVAAYLSGDPVMVREFEEGVDRHAQTAIEMFGPEIVDHPDFKKTYRAFGKMQNFLILFRGSAEKLKIEAKNQLSLELELEQCQYFVEKTRQKYSRLIEWQDELIYRACRNHYVEMPVTGHSRWFSGSRESIEVLYTPTIVNFPVQSFAAMLTQSAQMDIVEKCGDVTVRLNVYDAIKGNIKTGASREENQWKIEGIMGRPSIMEQMEQEYGRSMVWVTEFEWKGEEGRGRTFPLPEGG